MTPTSPVRFGRRSGSSRLNFLEDFTLLFLATTVDDYDDEVHDVCDNLDTAMSCLYPSSALSQRPTRTRTPVPGSPFSLTGPVPVDKRTLRAFNRSTWRSRIALIWRDSGTVEQTMFNSGMSVSICVVAAALTNPIQAYVHMSGGHPCLIIRITTRKYPCIETMVPIRRLLASYLPSPTQPSIADNTNRPGNLTMSATFARCQMRTPTICFTSSGSSQPLCASP